MIDGASGENRWLHRFAVFTAGATLFLIMAGGLVTSTGSGLSVPDWPLSYGMIFPPMVGGIFYEHGHRMIATLVGFLTVVLAIWLHLREPRKWVRNIGLVALLAVIVQGVLGGLTVIFLLPTGVSVAHASLAQTFFCLTLSIAVFTSQSWKECVEASGSSETKSGKRPALLATAVIYIQLIIGAFVRHTESGLAIPDFPLSFGHLIPPFSSLTVNPNAPFPISLETFQSRVAIQFLHRLWAGVVLVIVGWTAARFLRDYSDRITLVGPAILMMVLVLIQVMLGASVIWSEKGVAVTTAHVVVGASILGSSLVLTLLSWGMDASDASTLVVPRLTEEPAV